MKHRSLEQRPACKMTVTSTPTTTDCTSSSCRRAPTKPLNNYGHLWSPLHRLLTLLQCAGRISAVYACQGQNEKRLATYSVDVFSSFFECTTFGNIGKSRATPRECGSQIFPDPVCDGSHGRSCASLLSPMSHPSKTTLSGAARSITHLCLPQALTISFGLEKLLILNPISDPKEPTIMSAQNPRITK